MSKNKPCCLIAIDDDEFSLAAFQFYVEHLHRPGNRLVLVHIVLLPVKSTNQLAMKLEAEREVSLLNEKLRVRGLQDKYEDLMRAYKVPGGINVIYYSQSPGKILCEVAAEEKSHLIIIGSRCSSTYLHGSEAQSSEDGVIHLGEIGEYLLKKSPCPVLVARPYELATQSVSVHQDMDIVIQESQPNARRRSTLQIPNEQRIRKTSWPPPSHYVMNYCDSGRVNDGFLEEAKSEEKRRNSTNLLPTLQSKLSDMVKFFGGSNSDESVEDETVT